LQTVRSAVSACGDERWARKLACGALRSRRPFGSNRRFSERTLSIAKKILCRCARLDIAQGGRRTSGRCHCISATPRPAPAPPIKWWRPRAGLPRPCPPPLGAPVAHRYPRLLRLPCGESGALGPGRHLQGHVGPDATARAARPCGAIPEEGFGVVAVEQQRAVSSAQNGEVSARSALTITNAPSTLAREAAMQLVRNAEDCASNIQCMTW